PCDCVTHCLRITLPVISYILYSGLHPDLHSFPTRRSSDLGAYSRTPEICGAGMRRGERHKVSVWHFKGRPDPIAGSWRIAQTRVDRKSTRLNSSHVSISYAVFCLKKKTITKKHSTHLVHIR